MPDYRLNGVNPLAYMGVRPSTPPQSIINNNPPTTSDGVGYALGTFWTVPKGQPVNPNDTWVLTGASQGVFTWTKLEQHLAATETFTGNTGGPVGPDAAQNINLVGTGNINVAGNPSTHTLTISRSGGGGFIGLINKIYITATGAGTYTPTAGMIQCYVECVGGGGGSSGGNGALPQFLGGAGGGGAYSAKLFTSSEVGTSKPYNVGVGGAAGNSSAPATVGGNGGDTTFAAIITAGGGVGSPGDVSSGAGGSASGGDININGQGGVQSVAIGVGPSNCGTSGGSSFIGFGGQGLTTNGVGNAGQAYGGGAGGSINDASGAVVGAAGSSGIIIITEYLS